jgi:hypothetical protein
MPAGCTFAFRKIPGCTPGGCSEGGKQRHLLQEYWEKDIQHSGVGGSARASKQGQVLIFRQTQHISAGHPHGNRDGGGGGKPEHRAAQPGGAH